MVRLPGFWQKTTLYSERNQMKIFTFLAAALVLAVSIATSWALDTRVCYADTTQIPRDAAGTIERSVVARAQFVRDTPCPVNHQFTGACPGWSVDHVFPLADGGCDAAVNMQWLPLTIKSCAGVQCKDRWERRVYARPQKKLP